MLNLKCFKAGKGDSFLLSWESDRKYRLLIDCGFEGTYRFLRTLIGDFGINDYLIITHVDYDHVGGLFKWLDDEQQSLTSDSTVFLNTPSLLIAPDSSEKVGIKHGVNLEILLEERGIIPKPLFVGSENNNTLKIGDLELLILSPSKDILSKLLKKWTADKIYQEYQQMKLLINDKVGRDVHRTLRSKEDILKNPPTPHKWEDDLLNSSSIAFLLNYKGNQLLFLGDSNPDIICKQLKCNENELYDIDLLKISHHGSKHNTTKKLLKSIRCFNYLISTDSSGPYYHPSRETLILIATYGRLNDEQVITIYSNYSLNIDRLLSIEERKNIIFKVIEELDFENKI